MRAVVGKTLNREELKSRVPANLEGEMACRIDGELASRIDPRETLVISGFWRSGTTWLEETLREILQAKTLFEPCDPLAEDMQEVHMHDQVAGKKLEFLRLYMPYAGAETLPSGPLHELFRKALVAESRGAWIRRFRKGSEESHRTRVVVKFVRAQLCLRAAQNTFGMPVLHVYRDPRAVIASIKKTRWHWLFEHLVLRKQLLRQGDGREEFFGRWRDEILECDERDPVARVAAYWALTERFVEHSYADYPGRFAAISYEKLAAEREKLFAEILRKLGLRPAVENFQVSSADSTTTSLPQRGASVQERVAGWKKYLSADEIALIENTIARFGLAHRLAENA